jgi:DNA polymerase III delta subunit
MHKIKIAENIIIHTDAEQFILNVCNNTAKILINYMEKFKLLSQPITLELATNVCTNISFHIFDEYTLFIKNGQLNKAITILYNLYDKGYSVMDILDNYFLFVKITELLTEKQKYDVIPIICKYITIFHNIHEDEIELALFSNNMHSALETSTLIYS